LPAQATEVSVLYHYDLVSSVNGQYGSYALRCPDDRSSVSARANGVWRTFGCQGIDRLTPTFVASDVDAVDADGRPTEVFSPRRYTTDLDRP
jgi:hypothetical protein